MNKQQARLEALEFVIQWASDHVDRGDYSHRYPADSDNAKIETAIYKILEQLRRKIDRSEGK